MPMPRLQRYKSLLIAAVCTVTVLQASCDGDRAAAPAPVTATTPGAVPFYQTRSNTLSVILPPSGKVKLTDLTVLDSVSNAIKPSSTGVVTLDSYADAGSQIAVVLSPTGNPIMLGFLDANHKTIDASSTAEVFGYFALGGPQLLDDEVSRAALLAALPTANGIEALTQVIAAELAANPDAFATTNAKVTAAMATFVQAASGITPVPMTITAAAVEARAAILAVAHPEAISITPDQQSGITVLQDPPFAAHISNGFRRRSWAFVERVSHSVATANGYVDTADPATLMDFEVVPTVGVSGGVNGTIMDIVGAYFGNNTTAYGPVSSPTDATLYPNGTFSTPLLDGTDKTTYKITVVGPGGGDQSAVRTLTSAQFNQYLRTCVAGFVGDVIVPMFGNMLFGTGNFPGLGNAAPSTISAFKLAVINNFKNDFLLALPTLGTLQDKILKGNWQEAARDLFTNSTITGNAVQTILEDSIRASYNQLQATAPWALQNGQLSGVSSAMSNITRILGAAGAALEVFDLGVYNVQLGLSKPVETWTLNVISQKVGLNPSTANIDQGGSVALSATVLGVEDPSTTFSYQWTTTTNIGSLTEVDGNQRAAQSSYCSSSNQAIFTYEHSAVPNTTDTVTVQAFSAPSCPTGKLLGSGISTITYIGKLQATLAPDSPIVAPLSRTSFGVAVAGTLPAGVTYRWALGSSPQGSLSIADPAITTVPHITYIAATSGPDTLTAYVIGADGNVLATTSTTIRVATQVYFQMNVTDGSACCGGIPYAGDYTGTSLPTGGYGTFGGNYNGDPVYGFSVGFYGVGPNGYQALLNLRLALAPGTKLSTGTWATRPGILDTVAAGQFLFISDTSDNLGSVSITTLTPLPDGTQLAAFTFTEGSTSSQSTRAYSGSGNFIVPAN